jgi:hypothetical protein
MALAVTAALANTQYRPLTFRGLGVEIVGTVVWLLTPVSIVVGCLGIGVEIVGYLRW